MCYFVTLGVPARCQQAIERLEADGFHTEPASNPRVVRFFPPDDAVFTITRDGCACSFYAEPRHGSHRPEESVRRERYRRKGWSAAKISRALDARRRSTRGSAAAEHRARFADAVSRLVREIGGVRLFAHMYTGPIDTEPLGPVAVLRLPLAVFSRLNGPFPADTVVHVVDTSG